ncbi:MAG: 16S rRNA (guanine(527)-N(7))-methyltransferase RsmG [Anderseniella sp.]|nr:16S rRNA (guanine(527)-N(7))-methyltransferase RsmG [Anderseniella sp.]
MPSSTRQPPGLKPPAGFAERWNVSRESLEKLELYVGELMRWQQTHNLIAKTAETGFWNRHVVDALQLAPLLADAECNIIDIGSGGGIPAIPLAIQLQDRRHGPTVTMVESNAKKAAFLRTASRLCGIDVRIINKRIESMTDSDVKQPVDAVIARALAPVAELLALVAEMPVRPQRMLFLKGQHVDAELTEATKCWNISFSKHPSKTSPDGCILEINEAERVKPTHRSG